MLSRVAENIYWLGRYVERAENAARIVSVNANLLLDLPKGIAPGWRPLVDITGSNTEFEERYPDYSERSVVHFLLGDDRNPGSIRHTYLKYVILGAQGINGLLSGTMLHDQGYELLHLGRFLERADMTTRIVDVRSANLLPNASAELLPYETVQWVSVLKSMSAYQAYRRSEQVRVQRGPVLRFLFKHGQLPRAVSHCIESCRLSLERLPRNEGALRVAGRLKRNLDASEPWTLDQQGLHTYVDELQLAIGELHSEIARTWFPPPLTVDAAA
jgi:uncharacterized alpha-E superfamily protein